MLVCKKPQQDVLYGHRQSIYFKIITTYVPANTASVGATLIFFLWHLFHVLVMPPQLPDSLLEDICSIVCCPEGCQLRTYPIRRRKRRCPEARVRRFEITTSCCNLRTPYPMPVRKIANQTRFGWASVNCTQAEKYARAYAPLRNDLYPASPSLSCVLSLFSSSLC